MADNATNRGSQTAARESDTVIVPRITGNAGEGKDGTQAGPEQGTHLLYTGIEEEMTTKLDRIEEMSAAICTTDKEFESACEEPDAGNLHVRICEG